MLLCRARLVNRWFDIGYSRNHAVYASVSLRRARLRTDAGNQESSRPVPSAVCAERARTPRNRSAFARAPIGWQRPCVTGEPPCSSGYVSGRPAARTPAGE